MIHACISSTIIGPSNYNAYKTHNNSKIRSIDILKVATVLLYTPQPRGIQRRCWSTYYAPYTAA